MGDVRDSVDRRGPSADRRCSVEADVAQQAGGDGRRREVVDGDAAGRGAVARVVAVDRLDRGERLVERAEGEEPFTGGQGGSEARVLGHDWLPGSEVAGVALAEPAAPEPH